METEKELTINLIDIMVYVLRRWRTILIVTLIFAILFGGYKFLSYNKSSVDQYSEESRDVLTESLTNAEKEEIENLFSRYLAYRNSISYSESYMSNSILMHLDPNKLPYLVTQYKVSSDQHDVISSFTGQSLGAYEYKRIADVIGEGTDASRIPELVSVSTGSTEQNGVSIDLNNGNSTLGSINNTYKWILSLSVYSFNETQCEAIMAIVEEAVQNQFMELLDAGIDVSIVRIGTNYTESASKWLADRQRTMISETSSLKAEYDKFEKEALSNISSSEGKAYFTFLKNSHEGKTEKPHFSKAIVIGAALGFALTVFIFLLLYLFSNRIKNKDDYLYEATTDNIICIVYSTITHKGLVNNTVNRVINHLFFNVDKSFDAKEKIGILAKRIHSICMKDGINQLYIVNDTSKSTTKELLDAFIGILSQDGINVHYGNPLSSLEDYDLFEQSKSVLYWGAMYDTKKETLSDYLKLFTETNSKLLGSVLCCEL